MKPSSMLLMSVFLLSSCVSKPSYVVEKTVEDPQNPHFVISHLVADTGERITLRQKKSAQLLVGSRVTLD